jgi:hypothetical protein
MIADMAGIKVPAATRALIARLEPEQVGREFPLSAEKLSPILAFYAVPNLAAGIALCRRLLEFGGLGHTCAIHSHNRAAILEYGQAMPAFRVVVNSASVHGSIGYSTNLFPAMTLGCGAPGGNITSDNIGPQHLMNVKRIAWESRRVEHRTIPADQRMAGGVMTISPETASAKSGAEVPAIPVPSSTSPPFSSSSTAPRETKNVVSVSPVPAMNVDRATIARVVEAVLAGQGIARGSGAPNVASAAPAAKEDSNPSSIAAEIAGRFFSSTAKPKPESDAVDPVPSPELSPAKSPAPPAVAQNPAAPQTPAVAVSPFVSENDVRRAMTRSEKIFVGPKTILTPSARDLGLEHEVFVETEAGSIR